MSRLDCGVKPNIWFPLFTNLSQIKDESHECTSEIYETENKQPGGAEEQDEDEEEERPALSPHAIPVYMCFCWGEWRGLCVVDVKQFPLQHRKERKQEEEFFDAE